MDNKSVVYGRKLWMFLIFLLLGTTTNSIVGGFDCIIDGVGWFNCPEEEEPTSNNLLGNNLGGMVLLGGEIETLENSKFNVTLDIIDSGLSYKTLYLKIENLQNNPSSADYVGFLNMTTIINQTDFSFSEISNVKFIEIKRNQSYNKTIANYTTEWRLINKYVSLNQLECNLTTSCYWYINSTNSTCYCEENESYQNLTGYYLVNAIRDEYIDRTKLWEHEQKGLKHHWEQIPISPYGTGASIKEFLLKFEHPYNLREGGWGSEGVIWLDLNGKTYVDFNESSWWNDTDYNIRYPLDDSSMNAGLPILFNGSGGYRDQIEWGVSTSEDAHIYWSSEGLHSYATDSTALSMCNESGGESSNNCAEVFDGLEAVFFCQAGTGNDPDQTGNGYTLTSSGTAYWNDSLTKIGDYSIGCPGGSGCGWVTPTCFDDDEDFSIEFWAYFDTWASYGAIVYGCGSVGLCMRSGIQEGYVKIWSGAYTVNTVSQPSLDTWHHWVLTYNGVGNNVTLFIDGDMYETFAFDITWDDSVQTTRFLADSNTNYASDGLLDNIRMWERTLDGEEVRQLYNNTRETITGHGNLETGETPPVVGFAPDIVNITLDPTVAYTADDIKWNATVNCTADTSCDCEYLVSNWSVSGYSNEFWGNTTVDNMSETTIFTLGSRNTTSGELWNITIRCNNSIGFSAYGYSEINISNSLPSVSSVAIPSLPDKDDNLNVTFVVDDPDSAIDTCYGIINWSRNGVADHTYDEKVTCTCGVSCKSTIGVPAFATTFGDDWSVNVTPYDGTDYGDSAKDTVEVRIWANSDVTMAGWSYQEDVSSDVWCQGDWETSPSYPCSNLHDNDGSTLARADDQYIVANATFNYTKPIGALSSSRWQVKDGIGEVNLTINSSCWDAFEDKLRFMAVSDSATTHISWECYNSSDWVVLRGKDITIELYEEAMWWDFGFGDLGTYNCSDATGDGCIIVNASDITINCQGALINGTDIAGSIGVLNEGFNDTIFKSCDIMNYVNGSVIGNTTSALNVKFVDCNFSSNTLDMYIDVPVDTGATSPGTVSVDSGYGTLNWYSPDNIKVSDNDPATSYSTSDIESTYYIKATNFDFSISGTIIGILVEIKRKSNKDSADDYGVDEIVKIIKSNGEYGSTNKADTGTKYPTSYATASYGGAEDLWDESWSDTDINNANFGVALVAEVHGEDYGGYCEVDHITITVYYERAPKPPSSVFALNTTFTNIAFGSGDGSNFTRQWYLDVYVNTDGTDLEHATVNISDKDGNLIPNSPFSTDASGNIVRQNVTEYNETSAGITYLSNYTIYVNLTGYDTLIQSVNLTTNQEITVTLSPSDTCNCPSGENWIVDCSDDCVITEDCDINDYTLLVNGDSGTFTILANIRVDTFVHQNGCVIINKENDGKGMIIKEG